MKITVRKRTSRTNRTISRTSAKQKSKQYKLLAFVIKSISYHSKIVAKYSKRRLILSKIDSIKFHSD